MGFVELVWKWQILRWCVFESQCGRCRKRKIRCSGDPGDGTGCHNCKTSGTNPTQCQFLRVASYGLPTAPGAFPLIQRGFHQVSSMTCPENTYPYSTGSLSPPAAVPQLAGESGSYSSGSGTSSRVAGAFSSPASSHYGRVPSAQNYPVLATKPVPPTAFSAAYGGGGGGGAAAAAAADNPESYGPIPPQTMLSSQDALGHCAVYDSPDTLRGWNQLDHAAKPTSTGIYLDNGTGQYGHPALSLANPAGTRLPVTTADGSSLFPGLGSLSSSLPLPVSTAERALPKPRLQYSGPGMSNALNEASSTSSSSYNAWESFSSRSGQQDWPLGVRLSNGEHEPRKASSSSVSSAIASSDAKSPAPGSQDSLLTYGSTPIPSSQELAGTNSVYSANAATPLGMAQSVYVDADLAAFSATSTNDPSLGVHPNSDLYSYTAGSNFRHGSRGTSKVNGDEGTLVNGQPYTRLHQVPSAHTSPLIPFRRDSREARSTTNHQPHLSGFRT